MHFFRCTTCGHVDHTDSAAAAVARHNQAHPDRQVTFRAMTCTKCLTGEWHNEFNFRLFNPALDSMRVVNPLIH